MRLPVAGNPGGSIRPWCVPVTRHGISPACESWVTTGGKTGVDGVIICHRLNVGQVEGMGGIALEQCLVADGLGGHGLLACDALGFTVRFDPIQAV